MAAPWRGMGWELQPSQTRMPPTWPVEAGGAGFDGRGFTLRHDPTTATRGAQPSSTPSREAVAQPQRQSAAVVRRHRPDRQARLLEALNPVMRGWRHDVSTVCSRNTCEAGDAERRHHRRSWRRCRQPNPPRTWAGPPSGRQAGGRVHVRPRGGGMRLAFHPERPIRRHVTVHARRSPYDGDEVDGSTRQGHEPGVAPRVSTWLQRHAGQGCHGGDAVKIGDVLEVDHIIPRAVGGREAYTNGPWWHRSCPWRPRRARVDGVPDTHHTCEEPCEVATLRHGSGAEMGGAIPSSPVTGRGASGALRLRSSVSGWGWCGPRR